MLTLSAPPRPAENAAAAPRITFTVGSRAVIVRQALSACTCAARGSRPQASSTRDQTIRNARNFDNVANSSASAASRNASSARASPGGVPVSSSRRNSATAAASAKASSCAGLPPAAWTSARVSDQERPGKTLGSQRERGLDNALRLGAPVGRERSARHGREGIEAKRDRALLGPCARALDQRGETKRLIRAVGPKIEFEIGAAIETDAIESPVKRSGIEPSEAKTIGADRAGGHDLQPVRAVGEIVERLGVGLAGLGMIEARDDPPGTA